jgi:polar amino acid transport system substrate-binding protein
MSSGPKLRTTGLTVALTAALGVAGCGSSDKKSSSPATSAKGAIVDAKIAASVPAKVKSKGTLTVAADATYAPNEFIDTDGKTVIGMDADLAKAIATVIGLKVKVVNAGFDGIIPGIDSGRFDLGMSSFTDTKEREKTVDFVTYFSAGTSFFVPSKSAEIGSLGALCGHTVAAEKGTTQADDATAQSKKCTAAGKQPVRVLVYPDQTGANLALSSGRAEVGMADSPVAAYQVKRSAGRFKLSGASYGTAPYGIAIPKGAGLAVPIQSALKVLIANGTYTSILTRWGIQSGAITAPAINGALS